MVSVLASSAHGFDIFQEIDKIGPALVLSILSNHVFDWHYHRTTAVQCSAVVLWTLLLLLSWAPGGCSTCVFASMQGCSMPLILGSKCVIWIPNPGRGGHSLKKHPPGSTVWGNLIPIALQKCFSAKVPFPLYEKTGANEQNTSFLRQLNIVTYAGLFTPLPLLYWRLLHWITSISSVPDKTIPFPLLYLLLTDSVPFPLQHSTAA